MTSGDHDDASAVPPSPRVLDRRYELVARIGRGAHGDVWSAHDLLSHQTVAIKLIEAASPSATRPSRREIATLRAAQIPGVVRMLDEGIEGTTAYLVMEHIRGVPFPGREAPLAWRDASGVVLALVEIVARIHAAGVVHGDLKPGNVLVRDGLPIVLDFSLSRSLVPFAPSEGSLFCGTPAYVSPEILRGERATASSDLYALGVMFFEVLSGDLPFGDGSVWATLGARCFTDPPSIGPMNPSVPPEVVAVIDALLARDPELRPRGARDLLDVLAGRPSAPPPRLHAGARATLDELRAMIVGPERLFHVPSEAAELLWRRTGGVAHLVDAEVRRWCHLGVAQLDGPRVVINRASLDALHAPGGAHALPPVASLLREGVAAARLWMAQGRPGLAMVPMGDAWLTWLRLGEEAPAEGLREFFEAWVEVALAETNSTAIDRVLYELARGAHAAPMGDLEALLRCGLAVRTDLARAFESTALLPPFANRTLERLRWDLHLLASRGGPVERELSELEAACRWVSQSDDPRDVAACAGWKGWALYRQGRYLDAADQHVLAAALNPVPQARVSALLAAASALLEAFEIPRCVALAQEAAAIAEQQRLPALEARSSWLLRTARYREGLPLEADVELVELVASMGVGNLHAMVAWCEACFAFRRGEEAVAVCLAGEAARVWAALGREATANMARALALRCGAGALPGEVLALARGATASPMPRLALQTLALLRPLDDCVVQLAAPHVERLAAEVPPGRRSHRADILSIDESLAILRSSVPGRNEKGTVSHDRQEATTACR